MRFQRAFYEKDFVSGQNAEDASLDTLLKIP